MEEILKRLTHIEESIDKILDLYELKEENEKAIEGYEKLEKKLTSIPIDASELEIFKEYNRVLAYLYMRTSNMLRILGKSEEANRIQKLELDAARKSENDISIARSLFSLAVQNISSGALDEGILLLEDALQEFNKGDSIDHIQGAGWIWIIRADIMNAGILEVDYKEIVETCNKAIEILEPINNWQGLVRAHQARATTHKKNDYHDLAEKDKQKAESFKPA